MNRRNQQLSKIHIAKKDLAMDDDSYRAMLARVAGVTSAKDLDPRQVGAVLREFERLGWKPRPGRPKPNAAVDRQKLVGKIEAQLAEAGRSWNYADGLAQRLYKVERLEWLDAKQLGGVITALVKDAQRHRRSGQ